MKSSNYNLYSKTDKGIICFNTKTENFGLIPNTVYELIKNNLLTEIPQSIYNQLTDLEFLIDDNRDEYHEIVKKHNSKINDNIYNLILIPSLDCNVRCWYCFEKQIKGSRLNKRTQDAIFRHVQNIMQNDNIETLIIDLFGGEPLLHFEEDVFPLLSKIKEHVESLHKKVAFFTITNGLCISDNMLPKFKELNTAFQISIDGYKDVYNKVKKIQGSNEEPYKIIIEVIKKLTNCGASINLRINYDDKTIDHIEGIIQDLKDVDRTKILIHLERIWQTKQINSSKSIKNIIDTFLANGFRVSYMNFFDRGFSCKASKPNQSAISYNGDVYKCTGRDFTDKMKDGVLLENGNINWFNEKLHNRLSIITYENDLCKRCKYLPLCYGPCCQKQLEGGIDQVKKYCQLEYIEMSEDEYVLFRFNDALIKNNFNA